MKLAEITKKNDKELADFIVAAQADLAKAVIESRTKEIKDTKVIARHKRTIARALTVAREREIAQEEAK